MSFASRQAFRKSSTQAGGRLPGSQGEARSMVALPADTLRNRTFIGLLIAQFLAAFNDQAIHASAMFFAINTQTLTEAAGHLADADPVLRPLGHLLHPRRLPRRPLQQAALAGLLEVRRGRHHRCSPCSASGSARHGESARRAVDRAVDASS